MYRYSVPCNPRITLAAFLAHFFLQDYREGATPFSPAGRFQSTCPRRGTTIPDSKLEDSDDWFQSTLPRGERHRPAATMESTAKVSIHAPTRGATLRTGRPTTRSRFQSTLPRGERPFLTITKVNLFPVSIHAPTRGAT